LTLIVSVAVILAILVIASRYGIFWREFLHPRNYRRAILDSLIVFVVAWPVGAALLIAFFVLAFSAHGLAVLACFNLMVIVAVVGAVALIRALILLPIARLARAPGGGSQHTSDKAIL
jgi:hypothetical protein